MKRLPTKTIIIIDNNNNKIATPEAIDQNSHSGYTVSGTFAEFSADKDNHTKCFKMDLRRKI